MTKNRDEEDLRRERRAKMAEMRRQFDPNNESVSGRRTSAPNVRKVDQFQAEYGTADRKSPAQDEKKTLKWRKKSHLLLTKSKSQSRISKAEEDMILRSNDDLDQEIDSIFGPDDGTSSSTSTSGVSSGGLTSSMVNEGVVLGLDGHGTGNREAARLRDLEEPFESMYASSKYDPGYLAGKTTSGDIRPVKEFEDEMDKADRVAKDGQKVQ